MTVKSAALIALWGSVLLTILLAASLIRDTLGVVRGFIPAVTLVEALIYMFAALSAVFFFYAVRKQL
jgi:hypothetical protein